ncbi:MAG: hypothetical protein RMJ14_06425, partial [Nitrososphaerota archaeon]|nr:hypothetical protein [Aigarchaeota archaeon]MDW8077240.1 hypothetical protein [Nitrososphaerota archaeon]
AVYRQYLVRTGCYVGYTDYAEYDFQEINDVGSPVLVFYASKPWIDVMMPDFHHLPPYSGFTSVFFENGYKPEEILQRRVELNIRKVSHL